MFGLKAWSVLVKWTYAHAHIQSSQHIHNLSLTLAPPVRFEVSEISQETVVVTSLSVSSARSYGHFGIFLASCTFRTSSCSRLQLAQSRFNETVCVCVCLCALAHVHVHVWIYMNQQNKIISIGWLQPICSLVQPSYIHRLFLDRDRRYHQFIMKPPPKQGFDLWSLGGKLPAVVRFRGPLVTSVSPR